MSSSKLLPASLLTLALLSIPVLSQARTVVEIEVAPPAPRVEVVPAPRPGVVWAPGFWYWEDGHHVWHTGHWIEERRGYYWVPDRWVHYGDRYRHEEGHWQR